MNKIMEVTNKSMEKGSIELEGSWFKMAERCQKYLGMFNAGDSVEVGIKEGDVNFIKKVNQMGAPWPSQGTSQQLQPQPQTKGEYVPSKPIDDLNAYQLRIFRGQCLNLAHKELIVQMQKNKDMLQIDIKTLFELAEAYVEIGNSMSWLK